MVAHCTLCRAYFGRKIHVQNYWPSCISKPSSHNSMHTTDRPSRMKGRVATFLAWDRVLQPQPPPVRYALLYYCPVQHWRAPLCRKSIWLLLSPPVLGGTVLSPVLREVSTIGKPRQHRSLVSPVEPGSERGTSPDLIPVDLAPPPFSSSLYHRPAILTSQGLGTRLQRPWQTGLSWTICTWWRNDTLNQSQFLPSVYQRIRQDVNIHEVLKSWPAFLELQGMLGGCQRITSPLSWAVNGWELALPK